MTNVQNTARFTFSKADRRKRVAALYTLKMSQTAIADALKEQGFQISQPTVSRDIEAVTKEWKESAINKIDSLKMRELASLDRLELETQSMLQKVKERDSKREFICLVETILKIQKRRAELMGLDSPEKLDLKADQSGQIIVNLVRTSCRKEGGSSGSETVKESC